MHRTISLRATMGLSTLLMFALAGAGGQGSPSEDDTALRKAQDDFATAWNNHDAQAMAMGWAEDGDWIGPDGNVAQGRAAVENLLAEAHTGDSATSKIAIKVNSVRFLKPDVAVVDAECELTGMRDFFDKPLPTLKVLATTVAVKKDGKWRTAVYRAFVPPPPSED